jgi:imidazolonepropionase-like amidohydrolase
LFSHRIGSGVFALIALFASTHAAAESLTLIRGAKIFDGARVVDATDVLVRDDKIAQVGKGIESTKGVAIINGRGCTLLPGLIDCHTHVISDAMLEQALVFGVTTELDMFMSHELAANVKRENLSTRADLRTAGTLATAAGGHGTQFGVKIPTVENPEDAQAFVDARIAEGSDYIKIVYDTGRSLGLRFPTIAKETLAAVIQAAHKREKLAVVHVGDYPSATDAIEAGADGLAHVPFDAAPADGSFAKMMKAKGAFIVPTLAIVESACATHGGETLAKDDRLTPFLKPANISALRASFPRLPLARKLSFEGPLASVRSLHEDGVLILAGTDAPNPGTLHGVSIHRELELLAQCGFKPAEALAAATSLPASRFGLKDRGTIAPNMRADLLLVKGDATADIKATRAIVQVWRAGLSLDRDAYRRKIDDAKLAAGKLKGPGVTLVSDFEGGKVASNFGAGWQISTDSIMNGKSKAEMKLAADDGAQKSKSSLKISGTIDRGLPFAWAGAMFYPGEQPFAPIDLSGKRNVTFWAKGDGQEAKLMLFARKFGRQPASQAFTPGAEWKKFTFELSKFNNFDGADLMGVLFTGGQKPGNFEFQIDDVAFE